MSLKFTIEKLRQQPSRMTKRIREHGVLNWASWGFYQLEWRLRERRLGIDTLEHAYGINVWGKNGGQYYDPIDYRCLGAILDHMQPSPDHTFLDYGSGLGRALIAAAERPFRRALGVENNELLLDLCRKHVASAQKRGKFACPMEIIAADAEAFEVPPDVTRILMYNPFVEQDLMRTVLSRIDDSLRLHPRDLMLVYVPLLKHDKFLDDCSFLKLAGELPTGFWDHVRIMVYKNVKS